MTMPWLSVLDEAGLTLRGWLPLEALLPRPDGLLVEARAVWLLGSPGTRLWHAFQRYLDTSPEWLQRPHPLDDFVDDVLMRAKQAWEVAWGNTQVFTPSCPVASGGLECYVDFVALAKRAGWGMPGPLGMAVHPAFGPWFGLRAAVVTSHLPDAFEMPLSASVCAACEAPCIAACPSSAVQRYRFDVLSCADYRVDGMGCQDSCKARNACPMGTESRYEREQEAFHMRFSLGTLREFRDGSKKS